MLRRIIFGIHSECKKNGLTSGGRGVYIALHWLSVTCVSFDIKPIGLSILHRFKHNNLAKIFFRYAIWDIIIYQVTLCLNRTKISLSDTRQR